MDIKKICNNNKERVVTGAALLGIAGLVVFMDTTFLTWAILGIAYMVTFHEAIKLFGVQDNKLYMYALLLWIGIAFYPYPVDAVFIVLIVLISVMAHNKKVDYRVLAPFLYPTVSMLFLFTLYKDFGMSMLVWLVVVVAVTDTAAYFVGKSIGKTSFSPSSPNKTWEGVLGGIAIATLVGSLVGGLYYSFWIALVTSFFVSASSIWGDLFESYLKREAGVKDSGSSLPGHGGFLDRLDGYMFGVIVMVFILRWIA